MGGRAAQPLIGRPGQVHLWFGAPRAFERPDNAQRIASRPRHLASKLSESLSGLSLAFPEVVWVLDANRASSAFGSALPKAERAAACSGHCNNDFGKLFSP